MKQAWFYADPECGIIRDEFGGTHVYEDTGKTLAEDNPWHFQAPIYLAWLHGFTGWLHGISCSMVAKYYKEDR